MPPCCARNLGLHHARSASKATCGSSRGAWFHGCSMSVADGQPLLPSKKVTRWQRPSAPTVATSASRQPLAVRTVSGWPAA